MKALKSKNAVIHKNNASQKLNAENDFLKSLKLFLWDFLGLILASVVVFPSLLVLIVLISAIGELPYEIHSNFYAGLFLIVVNLFYLTIFNNFSTSNESNFKTFLNVLFPFLLTFVTFSANLYYLGEYDYISYLILLIFLTSLFLGVFLLRLLLKKGYFSTRSLGNHQKKKSALILEDDFVSISIAKAIINNKNHPYQVEGFLTEKSNSKNQFLLGKPVFTRSDFEKKLNEGKVYDGVLLGNDSLSKEKLNEWISLFLEYDLKILKVPINQNLNNEDLDSSIANIQIEDLLHRKPIKIDNQEVDAMHRNKSVLITGGAGTIGSEIARQVAQFNPSTIVLFDIAESPLYEIELDLTKHFKNVQFHFILGDVTNAQHLEEIFQRYHFSVVYHAAAYKHVPLVEKYPREGVWVNVNGSKTVALLSSKYKVERFVMISTDKAVNPTNVMGATKRTAELYVQSLQNTVGNTTKFITTRFGNVLGSNGSVLNIFKKQIEEGGPMTITHLDIERYFMTISEACELVLQAGTMGNGGEIYLFDMGKPVKIIDLAKRMIKFYGLKPEIDIPIILTGLRPGEKLYEELLSDSSKTMLTPHDKIMMSKDSPMEYSKIDSLCSDLVHASQHDNEHNVVRKLKEIVPEFKSNNSIFEQLD